MELRKDGKKKREKNYGRSMIDLIFSFRFCDTREFIIFAPMYY